MKGRKEQKKQAPNEGSRGGHALHGPVQKGKSMFLLYDAVDRQIIKEGTCQAEGKRAGKHFSFSLFLATRLKTTHGRASFSLFLVIYWSFMVVCICFRSRFWNTMAVRWWEWPAKTA